MQEDIFKTALHNPPHLFKENAVYIITGANYLKRNYLRISERKHQWLNSFRKAAEIYEWEIIAWVALDNHYHVLVRAPETKADNLPKLVASYHKFTSRTWNVADNEEGRQVWWNYWDTCIRAEKDYFARLNYIHWNPVKHRIVDRPEDYPFSSYRDFLGTQEPMIRKIETKYPYTEVDNVPDDF